MQDGRKEGDKRVGEVTSGSRADRESDKGSTGGSRHTVNSGSPCCSVIILPVVCDRRGCQKRQRCAGREVLHEGMETESKESFLPTPARMIPLSLALSSKCSAAPSTGTAEVPGSGSRR